MVCVPLETSLVGQFHANLPFHRLVHILPQVVVFSPQFFWVFFVEKYASPPIWSSNVVSLIRLLLLSLLLLKPTVSVDCLQSLKLQREDGRRGGKKQCGERGDKGQIYVDMRE